MKNSYKIILCDLDDTLIKTYTKKTFPKGIWDMEIKFDILDKIKKLNPEYVFIVTNQGGIGEFVVKEHFESKLNYISNCLQEYIGCKTDAIYCSSKNKQDPDRKPNIRMFDKIINVNNLILGKDFTLDDCLMIGDASGKPGQFSNSDKLFAENLNIDYIDVNEL